MKYRVCIILPVLLLLLSARTSYAQYSTVLPGQPAHSQLRAPNMDTDISGIRANAFPDARFYADDYIQYSPAAILLLTKACGYEGRDSWGRMIAADAFSLAFMASISYGLKYSLKRMRPDGTERTSFPSGHTARAFALATMLHKEYSWRSPWFSIGGYTIASAVGLMRLANNRHWMSDVLAGALIGIGSVHLGYLVNDKIFKDKHRNPDFMKPDFFYDRNARIYEFDLLFTRRFVLGRKALKEEGKLPDRGSSISINASIPIVPRAGIMARTGAGSMENTNIYNFLAGGYWTCPFAKRFQTGTHLLAGYARTGKTDMNRMDIIAGASISLAIAENFKIKVFAEYEAICPSGQSMGIHSVLMGFSSGFYF